MKRLTTNVAFVSFLQCRQRVYFRFAATSFLIRNYQIIDALKYLSVKHKTSVVSYPFYYIKYPRELKILHISASTVP